MCLGNEVAGQDYQIPLLNIYGYVAAEPPEAGEQIETIAIEPAKRATACEGCRRSPASRNRGIEIRHTGGKDEKIDDILLVFTYDHRTAKWPA